VRVRAGPGLLELEPCGEDREEAIRGWYDGAAGRRGKRAARAVESETYELAMRATHLREEPKEFDDVTLARKVETKLFRDPDVPKGDINVNAVDGVVYLRGQVPSPQQIDRLEDKARRVQGVRDVANLLHIPTTPAPTSG
jgi:osmotically-inducible protein OsmY